MICIHAFYHIPVKVWENAGWSIVTKLVRTRVTRPLSKSWPIRSVMRIQYFVENVINVVARVEKVPSDNSMFNSIKGHEIGLKASWGFHVPRFVYLDKMVLSYARVHAWLLLQEYLLAVHMPHAVYFRTDESLFGHICVVDD